MKIDCTDGVCSHLNHILTTSSASDSASSEQPQYFFELFSTPAQGILITGDKTKK